MSFPERLKAGYKSFRSGRYSRERARFEELAIGQKPKILVIGCCDSRVAPELIFDASPGELFVVRNVANLVPPCEVNGDYHGTSSAVQFAVEGLQVADVVVLGHGSCGGIQAFIQGTSVANGGTDFLSKWISLIDRAAGNLSEDVRDNKAEMQLPLEHAAIRQSLENLRSFPFIKSREKSGDLKLHGAWYGIADGRLHIMDTANGEFQPAPD